MKGNERIYFMGAGLICCCLLSSLSMAANAPVLPDMLAEEGDWAAYRVERRRMAMAESSRESGAESLMPEMAAAAPRRSVLNRIGALPVRLMVGFYRLCIAPAIGSRCVLKPSCSHFSMQAAQERGWLGVPMTGDRLVREPSVVVGKEHPVEDPDGRIRYADPVSDHIGPGYLRQRW